MASPPPFTGYVPRFKMPIIAPPPLGFTGTPDDYYLQLQIALTLVVSGPNGEFVDIGLTRATGGSVALDPTLFAMTGGFVRHYPPGMPIPSPDGFVDAQNGVLVLATWIGDVEAQRRNFPPDTPATSRIYYVGVDLLATETMLRAEIALMHDAALRASWRDTQNTPPPATHDALVDAHKLRVMAGAASVFVDGGTAIGKAAQDGTASAETYRFTLRMTAGGSPPAYVSPLPNFGGAPYYGF